VILPEPPWLTTALATDTDRSSGHRRPTSIRRYWSPTGPRSPRLANLDASAPPDRGATGRARRAPPGA